MGDESIISFEEFGLIQGQLIEYKTENYNLNETMKRLSLERKKLGDDYAKTKKDLDKANKIIATSKKNQEVAGILMENENLNHRLLMQEEDFRVQNQTLLLELTNLTTENEELRNNASSSSSSTSTPSAYVDEKDTLKSHISTLEEKLERKHELVQTLTAEKERLLAQHEAEKIATSADFDAEKLAISADFEAETERLSAEFEKEKEKICDAYDGLRTEKENLITQLSEQEDQHKAAVKCLEKKVSLSSADAVKLLREDVKNLKERLARSVNTGETFEKQLREREKEVGVCREEIQRFHDELGRMEATLEALRSRCEDAEAKAEEVGKVADKRKALIDEMAIQAQTDADHFTAEMTEMRKKHEEALETSEERMRETRKRGVEVDKLLNKLSEAKAQITSLENANGWFERRLAEADSQAETAKAETQQKLKLLEEEMEAKAKADLEEWQKERELLSTQLEEFQGEKSALNSLLDQLKAEIKDSADNYKIKERKNIQLAKDLKKQLINEQKRCAKLQERLQQVLSESQLSISGIEDDFSLSLSVNEESRMAETTSSVSSWSLVHSSANGAGRAASDHGSTGRSGGNADSSHREDHHLAEENCRLVERVAQLQEAIWSCEERVQYLETTNAGMADDLVQKSALIDHYSMRGLRECGVSEQNSPAHQLHLSTSSSSLTGGTVEPKEQHQSQHQSQHHNHQQQQQQQQQQQPLRKVLDFVREIKEITDGDGGKKETEAMRRRMGQVLEETLTKNMALQKDLETMSDEVTRLTAELKDARPDSPRVSQSTLSD